MEGKMITEIRTKDFPIQDKYEVSVRLGIIKGKEGYIVTETDLVHSVHKSDQDEVLVPIVEKSNPITLFPNVIRVSVKTLLDFIGEDIPLDKWTNYFGIKSRVRENYKLLQESCKEIGADIAFPEWGKGK
jgi:hypothetical protein